MGYVQGLLEPASLGNPFVTNPVFNLGIDALWSGFSRLPLTWWTDNPRADGSTEVSEAPLKKLLDSPNARMTAEDFWQCSLVEFKGRGIIYWFLADAQGKPIAVNSLGGLMATPAQILPVPAGSVTDAKEGERVVGLQYALGGSEKSAVFPLASVLAPRSYKPGSATDGLGAADVLRDELGIWAAASMGLQADLSSSDGGAFIVYDRNFGEDEQELRQTQLDGLAADEPLYKALGGGPTIIPNTSKAKDKGYKDTRTDVRDMILAKLGVPPNVVGFQDNATYENLRTSYKQLWRGPLGIVSLARVFQGTLRELQRRLILGRQISVELFPWFSTTDIPEAQDDHTDKVLAAAEIASKGFGVSFNDALAVQGVEVEPLDDGGRRFLAANLQEVVLADPDADEPPPVFDSLDAQQAAQLLVIVGQVKAGQLEKDEALALVGLTFNVDPDKLQELIDSIQVVPQAAPIDPGAPVQNAYQSRAASDLVKPDRVLKERSKTWLRQYESAQIAKIRAFAKDKALSADGLTLRAGIKIKASDWAYLLLSRKEWSSKLAALTGPSIKRLIRNELRDTAKELGVGPIKITDPKVIAAFNAQKTKLAEDVAESTERAVRQVILKALAGQDAGKPLQVAITDVLPDLSASLKQVFGDKERRGATISRTETGKAQNTSRFLQYQEAGVDELEWRTSPSGDHREDHAAANGERIKLGERFSMGLRYPHEEGADADQVINCSLDPNLIVSTARGSKAICKIEPGDMVLTSLGRYRRVTRTRPEPKYTGVGVTLRTIYGEVCVTGGHPVKSGSDWYRADSLKSGDNISVLFNTSNIQELQLLDKGVPHGAKTFHVSSVAAELLRGNREVGENLGSPCFESEVWKKLKGSLPTCPKCGLKSTNRPPLGVDLVRLGAVNDTAIEYGFDFVKHAEFGVGDDHSREWRMNTAAPCGSNRETSICVCESGDVCEVFDPAIHHMIVAGSTPLIDVELHEVVNVPAYNFSVDEDESYVLSGVVSHNCRCRVIGHFKDNA